MEKINNSKFVESIKIMKEDPSQQNQSKMLGEMMQAKFLNPTTLKVTPNEEGKVEIPMGTKVNFFTIISTDKKKFAMAFTSDEELNKWYDTNVANGVDKEKLSKNAAIMDFMEYANIILNDNSELDGLVINPYNENIVFNREQISSLKEQKINKDHGITRNKIEANEQVGLKKISNEEFPTEMIENVIEHMKTVEQISKAWIMLMKKNDVESYLMVVDFDGDPNIILGEIARISKKYLTSNITSLDMVHVNTPLGKEAIKFGDVFYDKNGVNPFKSLARSEESELVIKAKKYVRDFFEKNYDGHDFYHTFRVYELADRIAALENANIERVRLASLLHDVDDRKIVGKNYSKLENARRFLKDNYVADSEIEAICDIISKISFKGDDTVVPESLEGKVVQDADRLDAIGAIGIARVMYYHGNHNLPLHNPDSKYRENISEDEYYSNDTTAINHFYEKILKLKDMMNTETAKKIAIERHKFVEEYIDRFYKEWDGLI